MSSFKELKKKNNIKVWENKIKRLYACEELTELDLKYLNVQFDYYKLRKTYIVLWSLAAGFVSYNFFYVKNLHLFKKVILSCAVTVLTHQWLRSKNRTHYETIVTPYFEKYYIK